MSQSKKQKMSEVLNERVISLQIGESRFQVSQATFNKLKNKEVFTIIEGDTYYVDRDGDIFKYILKYLRSDIISFPNDFNDGELLKKEAEFYGLSDLRAHLQNGAGKPERVTLKIIIPEENHVQYGKPGIDILLSWTTFPVDWETLFKGFKDRLMQLKICKCNDKLGDNIFTVEVETESTFDRELQPNIIGQSTEFAFHVQDDNVPTTIISGFLTSGFSLVREELSSSKVEIFGKVYKSVRELEFQRIKPVN
ncbi:putative potassium channel regulatory protein [Apostichopus japonicus]|uniref:Putative potassium channel regulatory protein n=1 Tax=Stichopus japonicus TaxID=307972 RepID=A0A2G8JUX7_STIJA|nr:putative potassium channel regulatory protein [Apostichopus japonicus]